MTDSRIYTQRDCESSRSGGWTERCAGVILIMLMLFPFDWVTALAHPVAPAVTEPPDTVVNAELMIPVGVPDSARVAAVDTLYTQSGDTILDVLIDQQSPYGMDGRKIFNPSPTRAVWLSALFPGLGQIYNRRYWKLPIVVGGFMGLGYATNWNNNQFQDYSQGYRDLLDNDPNTNSYMDFFPPTTSEDQIDKTWLTQTMKSRKDYYRRNRDLCIICMVGLYLLCMVDAYVDASLSHFDISPDVALDMQPSLLVEPSTRKLSMGLTWALTF